MRFFGRKSKWDRLRETAMSAAAGDGAREAGKLALTAVGGAVAVTLASAAVSSLRHGKRT